MDLKRETLDIMKDMRISIFVINFEPLKDRRDYLKKRFRELGIISRIRWIIQKKGEYSKKFKSYSPSKEKWEIFSNKIDNEKYRILRESDFNIMMNHKKIHKIIKKEKIPLSLVLEDDVILDSDFLERINKCLKILPRDFDICYTDAGMNLRLPRKIKNFRFYKYEGKSIRTTASYFISLDGAKKLSKPFEFILPVDWEYRCREIKENMKVFWLAGYLTYQGSLYGDIYKTTMQVERDSFGKLRKLLLNLEKKRYNKDIWSRIMIFFFDFFYIIPYRFVRILLKKLEYKN